jgi:hypothetical protein
MIFDELTTNYETEQKLEAAAQTMRVGGTGLHLLE